jgi:ComF family protein
MKLLTWLGTMLFPDKCILCGKLLEDGELDLCTGCRVQAPECPVSKIKFPFIDQWTALWYYKDHVRKSLLKYKFQNCRSNAAGYGRLLAMKLMKEDRLDFDVLTWIPISRQRKRRRGFDQVELLAQKLGAELQIMPMPTLEKVRNNRQQSRIIGSAQRRANVLGAYIAIAPENIAGKRVLLLDDIITTGATASECARILLTAGAKEVQLAVLATANQQTKTNR